MEQHIDFLKIKIIVITILLIFVSCGNSNKAISVNNYYNFKFSTSNKFDFIYYDSKINLDNEINSEMTYFAKVKKGKIENNVLESYFIFNGVKYQTPLRYRNLNSESYKYSLMPKYSEKNLVAKKFNYDNFSILLIRGENPFCNGNNCKSYYLHLLLLEDKVIKLNYVYLLNDDDVNFEKLDVSLRKETLLLTNEKTIIDKLKLEF